MKRFSALLPILIPLCLLLLAVSLLAAAEPAAAVAWESERAACARLAPRYDAAVEVRLSDGCRVDLLTDSQAIEVDWAKKWAESIGQALYYSIGTDREPAVILLTRGPRDQRYVRRCQAVCDRVRITLYTEPARRVPKQT